MGRPVTVHIGSIEATARTKTEAKALLDEKVDFILRGNYIPKVLFYRGRVGLIWREPSDTAPWWYTIVREEEDYVGIHRTMMCEGSCEKAERELRRWLAQDAWKPEDKDVAPAILVNEEDRMEFIHLVKLLLEESHNAV